MSLRQARDDGNAVTSLAEGHLCMCRMATCECNRLHERAAAIRSHRDARQATFGTSGLSCSQ